MVASTPRIDEIEDPSQMTDDELATKLGRKAYLHGTTYNGGNAPTITLSAGGGTLSSALGSRFIPYQMQDGSWRMKFNINATVSTTARTTPNFQIAGITFQAIANGVGHSLSGGAGGLQEGIRAQALENTNTIEGFHASASTNYYNFSGDVPLASKPTWAY